MIAKFFKKSIILFLSAILLNSTLNEVSSSIVPDSPNLFLMAPTPNPISGLIATSIPTPTPTWTNARKNAVCRDVCYSTAALGYGGCTLWGAAWACAFTPLGGVILATVCDVSNTAVMLACLSKCDENYPS